MNDLGDRNLRRVRKDFVPVDNYISREVLELEKKKLWPKTWLIACREEELQRAGDYVVFDIADESYLIVRAEDGRSKAYYNVCQHRGRRLKDRECGNAGKKIYCPFHGWTYNLDGSINTIRNRADWEGCPDFGDQDIRLQEVRIESWAGWLWVTSNPTLSRCWNIWRPCLNG